MSDPASADIISSLVSPGSAENKEKYLRFERLGEIVTWLALVLGVLIVQLPFSQGLNRNAVYILCAFIGLLAVVWYHLIPKRFSGLTKNFINSLLLVIILAFLVHNTSGVRGYAVFLYFLPTIAVAITMPLLQTLVMTLFVAAFIFLEAFLTQGALATNLSLAVVHSWALFLVVFYSRLEASEAALAKEKEEKTVLEKEKALGQLKDEFVFIISHKLKQPAAAIKGSIETIFSQHSKLLNAEAKKILELTDTNSERLTKLLDDLLDVSRIEQGSLRVKITDVFIQPIISEVLSSLFFEARNKKISLAQKGDLEVAVKADADRLKEVLTNLVGNAIKYTPEGGQVTIEVKSENEFTRVLVSDNGFGISAEDQKHLFEKFYRVQNEKTKAVKGSGLGLFITRQLVEKMGGEIGVTSKDGQGTTFYFTLPRW